MSTLPQQEWLNAAPTRAVMAALDAARPAGHDGPVARFVGGCVRNALLGQPVDDIDIASILTPQQVIAAMQAVGIRTVPTGIEHGTVTAIAHGRPYEITTLRRDVETNGRRAVVAFSTNWTEDAERRDFRLNAIYADADGTLFDPVAGVADAKAGRVVFIGKADDRIREDYLRVLRFFRFSAWYGKAGLDEAGLAACGSHLDGLHTLSVERVWKELKKLLSAPDPRAALAAMEQSGVLGCLLPESTGSALLDHLIRVQTELAPRGAAAPKFAPIDAMPRLMALLLNVDQPLALAAAARLKMSNEEKERLTAGLSREGPAMPPLSERAARAALYRLGARTFCDKLTLGLVNAYDPAAMARYKSLRSFAQTWATPRLPVNGDDLLRAGLRAGPEVGVTLRKLEQWWVDNDFPSDRKMLLVKAVQLKD